MASWIEEREQRKLQRRLEQAAMREAEARRARDLSRIASSGWASIATKVQALAEEHNRACQPQAHVHVQRGDDGNLLILSGRVVEIVSGHWFSAPAQVELLVRFDATNYAISFEVLGRTKPQSMYFDFRQTGEAGIYAESSVVTEESAAELILSALLDVIDPIR